MKNKKKMDDRRLREMLAMNARLANEVRVEEEKNQALDTGPCQWLIDHKEDLVKRMEQAAAKGHTSLSLDSFVPPDVERAHRAYETLRDMFPAMYVFTINSNDRKRVVIEWDVDIVKQIKEEQEENERLLRSSTSTCTIC